MNDFLQIVKLIQTTRYRALSAVNSDLVNLYWQVGQYVSMRLEKSTWGDGMVAELAAYIKKHHPEIKGFDKRSLYRMCLFYQTYSKMQFVAPLVRQIQEVGNELITIVAPLEPQLQESSSGLNGLSDIRETILAQISWSHHLIIMGRCKNPEEMEFYIRLCIREHYSKRELDRQINSSAFERVMIGNAKLPESIRKLPQEMTNVLKDSYVFEFLNLPEPYMENDLRKALLHELKQFMLELGPDYLFVGEEFPIKVGNRDFRIDLVFFHRSLQCLVAFELKTDRFEPEYLGKTNFYLEALDRDVRNANENPSIGVLLCKDRDEEVVEYALSRSLSPTMVARYLTQMPDKKLLQQKLHELFEKEEKNNLDQ
ncbi:MAG: PDDEXK nuclease domain-containing protein [Bacteroidota bacterium]|nr:PDDEXK nuclease domain-containing protein [Bacteroidota bacterium]MDO9615575.1 PDDEXK nuclease domain-containing protein [Bacteroidota bacterium]